MSSHLFSIAVLLYLVLVRPLAAEESVEAVADALVPIGKMSVGERDWPQWGGSSHRNNTPEGKNIPHHWNVASGENVLWKMPLGSQTHGTPAVANGTIFIGTNNANGYVKRYPSEVDLGALIAFEEKTGKFLWQASSPKLLTGRVNDSSLMGVWSTPYCERDRLWYVTNRGEVVCLDLEGFRDNENDGPFTQEGNESKDEDDIVWTFDMMAELGVSQHNRSSCSITGLGDRLFVITGNGVGEAHNHVAVPDAPSFLCLDKNTGKVLWSDNSPGLNILHGQWSSPCVFRAKGRDQVVMCGGDGWIYSFDPAGDGEGRARLLWKFDGNPKDSHYRPRGKGTRNPIIATPVFHNDLVYVGLGDDPEYGESGGHLYCIDPTKDGDVSQELAVDAEGQSVAPRRLQAIDPSRGEKAISNPHSALVWHYTAVDRNQNGKLEFEETMHRTISSVAIKNDLLIVADFSGLVHCLDAKRVEEGKPVVHWVHDMFSTIWSSPLIVDDKIYVGDEDGDVIVLELSKSRNVIAENNLAQPIFATPIVANDTLFIANRNTLFALKSGTISEPDESTAAVDSRQQVAVFQADGFPPVKKPVEEVEKSLRGDDEPLNKAAEPRKNTAEVTPNSLLEATSPPVPTDRIQSQDVLVIETKEGLSGYSMSLGKWDRVVVGFPKDGRSRLERTIVHNTFAAAIIDDQLFGFSSKVGRWGKMKIPPEYVGKVQPVVGPNLASIKIGDRTYALSPITAEWTSSDEAASSEGRLPQVDLRGAENKLRLALDTSEARRLADEILKYETRAVKLAEQIREFNKGTPVRDKDAAKIVDLRRELDVVLGKALDLKTQVEQLRVKELQARLSRMEQQIGRRQAQRAQIIKRRADELIEGDETKWGDEPTSRPTESFTAGSIPQPGTYQPQPVPAPPQVMTATVEKGTLDSSSRPANPGQKLNIPPEDSNKTVQPQKEVSTTVVANQKRQNEFFVMDEDGSNLRSLFRFGQHPMIGSPSVSPNGEWLAFDDVTTKPGTEQIYVMRLDGGEPRRICSGMMPTWSSDNRFLICTRREPRYGIWRVDTLTEERKFLRMGSGAQMSPDGKRLIFVSGDFMDE